MLDFNQPAPTSVLFFGAFPPPYTGQAVATDHYARLLSDDCTVRRVNMIDPQRHERASGSFRLQRFTRLLRHLTKLRHHLRTDPPDTFYFTPSSTEIGLLRDLLASRLARPHATRIVGHIHTGDYDRIFRPATARLARRLVRQVDVFLFLSEGLYERSRAHVPSEKAQIVPNTVAEELIATDAEVADKLARRGARVRLRVLFLSNMILSKGYADVAEALGLLAERGTPFEADFIGGWPDADTRAAFEARLKALGICPAVRVHGAVQDRARIRQLLLDADVLTLPTYYSVEAQPLAILEAMNAATPIVTTAHASIPDYVFPGENGFLVDARAPAQLADAFTELAVTDRWAAMARAARQTYTERFSPEAVRSALYHAVTGHPLLLSRS